MNKLELSQFSYNKNNFELDVISCFKNFDSTSIKSFIDIEMRNCCQTFQKNVFRRIISYKIGKSWWLEPDEICNTSKITSQLVAIWKLVIAHKRFVYDYEGKTVEEYAQDRLADVEKDLADGKFNEQTYIEKCNWIMRLKKSDEILLNCCGCSPIGNIDSQILHIICMPCQWDKNTTCIRFDSDSY